MRQGWWGVLLSLFLLAGLPASTNYSLNSYGIGSGGTASSSSTNYSMNGITGEQSGSASSTNYQAGAGENYLKQANVPELSLSDPYDWYDKLDLVIDPQSNPSDATFLIEFSTDSFSTIYYLQDDFTTSTTFVSTDLMTYAELGGSGGITVRGLQPDTVYSARAAASRGEYTQSQFGPVATGTTASQAVAFAIGISSAYSIGSPPYNLNMGNLVAGSVYTAPNNIWITVSTNADNGLAVYEEGANGGLSSASTSQFIPSASEDLSTVSSGFGMQDTSETQSTGGPMFAVAPYNVTGTNVGEDFIDLDEIYGASSPVTDGVGEVSLLAKVNSLTEAAPDFTETLTEVVAGSY